MEVASDSQLPAAPESSVAVTEDNGSGVPKSSSSAAETEATGCPVASEQCAAPKLLLVRVDAVLPPAVDSIAGTVHSSMQVDSGPTLGAISHSGSDAAPPSPTSLSATSSLPAVPCVPGPLVPASAVPPSAVAKVAPEAGILDMAELSSDYYQLSNGLRDMAGRALSEMEMDHTLKLFSIETVSARLSQCGFRCAAVIYALDQLMLSQQSIGSKVSAAMLLPCYPDDSNAAALCCDAEAIAGVRLRHWDILSEQFRIVERNNDEERQADFDATAAGDPRSPSSILKTAIGCQLPLASHTWVVDTDNGGHFSAFEYPFSDQLVDGKPTRLSILQRKRDAHSKSSYAMECQRLQEYNLSVDHKRPLSRKDAISMTLRGAYEELFMRDDELSDFGYDSSEAHTARSSNELTLQLESFAREVFIIDIYGQPATKVFIHKYGQRLQGRFPLVLTRNCTVAGGVLGQHFDIAIPRTRAGEVLRNGIGRKLFPAPALPIVDSRLQGVPNDVIDLYNDEDDIDAPSKKNADSVWRNWQSELAAIFDNADKVKQQPDQKSIVALATSQMPRVAFTSDSNELFSVMSVNLECLLNPNAHINSAV